MTFHGPFHQRFLYQRTQPRLRFSQSPVPMERLRVSIKTTVTDLEMDAMIAATALVHGMAVVTLNRKHFERLGVELVEF